MRFATWYAIVLSALTYAALSSDSTVAILPPAVFSGSKGRVLRMDLNTAFPKYCRHEPSARSPSCLIVLTSEPRRGDLFSDQGTSGKELHTQRESGNDAFCESNVWVYVEDTFTREDDDGDYTGSSGLYDQSDKRRFQIQDAKYYSGENFDAVNISIYSPPDAAAPNATSSIIIRMINHRPVAVSSTLVLRATDPWSESVTDANAKAFLFPRYVFLQGTDPDVSEENPDELMSADHVQIVRLKGVTNAAFVDRNLARVDGDEAFKDEANVYLLVNTSNAFKEAAALRVIFCQKDKEGALSVDNATTDIFIVPTGKSMLPAAPYDAGSTPQSFSVNRLTALPTLVTCRYLIGGTEQSDCQFGLLGGDILSVQVSMNALFPTDKGPIDIDVAQLVKPSLRLGEESDTEGSYRLTLRNESLSSWESYYPSTPESYFIPPLFAGRWLLSDITESSPPDVIDSTVHVTVEEYSIDSSSTPPLIIDSTLHAPLKVYSQYVATPRLVCDNVSFVWTSVTRLAPASCGRTTEYDTECTDASHRSASDSIEAELSAFHIVFESAELNKLVWYKDVDAVYLVRDVVLSSTSAGCVYHRKLFRPIIAGDLITSEEDLTWMPLEAAAIASSMCPEGSHAQITVALVLGESVACNFLISAPSTSRVPSTSNRRLFATEVVYDRNLLFQGSERGALVIPFLVHDAIGAVVNATSSSQHLTPEEQHRRLRLVQNVASHAVMASYSNGAAVYPLSVVAESRDVFAPQDAFRVSAPRAFKDAPEAAVWLSHVSRHLTAVTPLDFSKHAAPARRVEFSMRTLVAPPSNNKPSEFLRVSLIPDASSIPNVRRAPAHCDIDAAAPSAMTAAQLAEVSSRRFSFVKYDSSGYDKKTLLNAQTRGVAEGYDDIMLADSFPEKLWFQSPDINAHNLRLVVTKQPRLARVFASSPDESQMPWSAASKALGLPLVESRLDGDACGSLTLEVSATAAMVDATPGELPGYADDELRVAATDGAIVGPEVVFRIRVLKSKGDTSGYFDTEAVAIRSMDLPILVCAAIFLLSVVAYYRRKLRRMMFRRDADSDSTEDVEEDSRRRAAASSNILRSIRSMVATRSATLSTLISSRPGQRKHQRVRSDDAEDETALEEVQDSTKARLEVTTLAANENVVKHNSDDDWDAWETNGCAPHPSAAPVQPAPKKKGLAKND